MTYTFNFTKVGEADGDDYLAELDYIEVVERMKEDYESDVEDDLDDDEETPQKRGSEPTSSFFCHTF